MRATFALGGGGGQESDPALEPSAAGGHTLLSLAWWQLHGAARTPAREDEGRARTVEIDPGTRQAALGAGPALPLARRLE